MSKTIKFLIIENHPLIIDAFKKALYEVDKSHQNFNFKISTTKKCETASVIIKKATPDNIINIVLLNINLASSSTSKSIFADDLALEIRKVSPKTKLILFINHFNDYRVSSILRTLDPECFLINSDITFKELVSAIETCLIDPPYYSKRILQFIKRRVVNDYELDRLDRLILFYLSKGVRTKDLPCLVNLSKSGIEKRKRVLREVFNTTNNNDSTLLKIAKENGII